MPERYRTIVADPMNDQQTVDIRTDVQDFILDCLASLPPEQATPMLGTDRWRRIKDWVKEAPAKTSATQEPPA